MFLAPADGIFIVKHTSVACEIHCSMHLTEKYDSYDNIHVHTTLTLAILEFDTFTVIDWVITL